MKRERHAWGGNGTGKKKPLRVKAEEMERTGEMGERMFEIKRKQSSGRWTDRQYETAAERRGGEAEPGRGERRRRQ